MKKLLKQMLINNKSIKFARPTGGKAGKGKNKTSTVQVMENGRLIKSFRYKVGSMVSRSEAWIKAQSFRIDN